MKHEFSRRPVVAILLPDMRPGGAERLHVNLAEEWERQGISVTFLLSEVKGALLDQLPKTVDVVDLQSPRVRNILFPLVRFLKSRQPSVLIAAMWPLTIIAPLAAKLAGFKGQIVISEHSPLSLAYSNHGPLHRIVMRESQRRCYPLADVRIAVSSGIADDLAKSSGLSRNNFTVIHNPAALGCADFNAPRPPELSHILGPVILTVGTLKPVKRHDLLIDAFGLLSESLTATLCILGDGQMRGDLEQQISNLGLQGKVLLPGYVADPGPWYAHSDLFVLSSDYEGFGNVIVEAMEYGLRIVSTDCPVGPAEILDQGRYGKLVPPANAKALSCGMLAALGEDCDVEELTNRAKDFSLALIARQYLNVMFS